MVLDSRLSNKRCIIAIFVKYVNFLIFGCIGKIVSVYFVHYFFEVMIGARMRQITFIISFLPRGTVDSTVCNVCDQSVVAIRSMSAFVIECTSVVSKIGNCGDKVFSVSS